MAEMTFVFTQARKGRRKKTLQDVSDWEYNEDEARIVIEHNSGPDTTFKRIRRLDAAYRGDDPEYAGPAADSNTEY